MRNKEQRIYEKPLSKEKKSNSRIDYTVLTFKGKGILGVFS